ncbi:Cvm1p RNJ42_03189 [Nakaseomyces bracarensis]|uniref:Cvm1p n=1 Tax=Nakaseomyces bracarensis TaxID=273131 RepID=UPI0038714F49
MQDVNQDTWYQNVWNRLPQIRRPPLEVNVTSTTQYSQLNREQVEYLENEALTAIKNRNSTWCWLQESGRPGGIVSVHGTDSRVLPLPLAQYPGPTFPGQSIYVKHSMLLPAESPLEIYHEQPLRTKLANAVKHHYNFPNERHLYLRKQINDNTAKGHYTAVRGRKVLVVSVVSMLPDKYEKATLGKQPSAHYLSSKFVSTLKHEDPKEVISLSLEVNTENNADEMFESLLQVFNNWKFKFKDAGSIFILGVYNTVPLAIKLTRHMISNSQEFGFTEATPIGLMAFESCLGGYRFWDHSIDISSTTEQDIDKLQQAREKQLYQGCSTLQQDSLSNIKQYCSMESEQSRQVQKDLDWILYHWDLFRMTFVGKVYDNFMTISQKLAMDYVHPKIMRSIWCNGKYLGIDPHTPAKMNIPDNHLKTIKFDCNVQVPKERVFELALLQIILLALNLGYTSGTSLAKLIGPYFISRSYNDNTIPANVRKQQQYDLKIWLQEMEEKWKDVNTRASYMDEMSTHVSSVHSFLEFTFYQAMKSPDLVEIRSDVYDDDSVYKLFLENTTVTKSPIYKKPLLLHQDQYMPSSIFDRANQYDLVWKFHEFLSNFVSARNLPRQNFPPLLSVSITLDYSFWRYIYPDNDSFHRTTEEARRKLTQLWESYADWDPPIRGLKKLQNILSVLSIYKEPSKFIEDIQRKL